MVCLYEKHIFKGKYKMWSIEPLEYLGEWLTTEEEFLKTYHLKYPNEKIQIFRHKFKPLAREFRVRIEEYMKTDPFFIQLKRQETLNKLLS